MYCVVTKLGRSVYIVGRFEIRVGGVLDGFLVMKKPVDGLFEDGRLVMREIAVVESLVVGGIVDGIFDVEAFVVVSAGTGLSTMTVGTGLED